MSTVIDVRHREIPVLAISPAPTITPAVTTTSSGAERTDLLVAAARNAAAALPTEVVERLRGLATDRDGIGALILSGLPVSTPGVALPETPPSPTAPTAKDLTSETVLLAVSTVLGEPVGYLPEHGGDIVQNILPTADDADRQTSTSSRSQLGFHTETAFHPHRPRFLVLLCLRGDDAAATTLCCIDDLLGALSQREIEVLSAPRFRTRADESFGGGPGAAPGASVPVLSGDPEHPTLVVDAELTTGNDEEAVAALARLTHLIETHHTSAVLRPGDVLVVDNHRCVHGRTAFPARFDGTDRWLQRAFVVDDLAPSAGERVGRIITTEFA